MIQVNRNYQTCTFISQGTRDLQDSLDIGNQIPLASNITGVVSIGKGMTEIVTGAVLLFSDSFDDYHFMKSGLANVARGVMAQVPGLGNVFVNGALGEPKAFNPGCR